MIKLNKFLLKVKLITLALLIVICIPFLSQSQTVNLANYNGTSLNPGDTIIVPVYLDYSGNLFAFDLYINFNTDILTFVGYDSVAPIAGYWNNPSTDGANSDYKVKLGWGSNAPLYYDIFSNTRLARLKLKYHGGSTNITFATGSGYSYIEDLDIGVIDPNNFYTGGSASGTLAPIASVATGGNWSAGASWDLGHKPNTSNSTITVNSTMATPLVLDDDVTTAQNVVIGSGKALTVSAGKALNVTGNFTIQDGGSYINNGTADNTATMERMIAKDNKWHFIASPVAAQAITPAFAPTVMDGTFDFFKWDETINTTAGLPWINLRANATTYNPLFETAFAVGRGYLVAYSNAYTGNENHSFTGVLGNGDKSIAISNSLNQYNLIGNPYPSAIDWDVAGLAAASTLGATPSISIWNETTGNFGSYVAGSSIPLNDVSNIIAPNQGFYVQAIAAGNFVMPNTARVHGAQSFLKSTVADYVKLHVSSNATSFSDEMIVKFDNSNDVNKWFSLLADAPSLYSVKNNTNLTINNYAAISSNLTVDVAFKAGVNGNYNIKASNLNFSTPTYVYLKDLVTNTITDLNNNNVDFTATTTDNVNRFQLIFALAPLSISNNVIENTNIYSFDNSIYVNSNEAVMQINIYNTLGQLIKTVENKNGFVSINMNGFTNGYYIVKVVTTKNVYSEKVIVK